MNTIKNSIKKIPGVLPAIRLYRILRRNPSLYTAIHGMRLYRKDWKIYARLPQNPAFPAGDTIQKPCIYDKTVETPVDVVYFYQDAWCARKVFQQKPPHHYDVASKAEFVAIVSQFVPTTMFDIRPVDLELSGLTFQKADIYHLPLADQSVSSLSSICVLEHIGLGRYGDVLDPFGSEKAIAELKRVLAPGGDLYISVPVDTKNRTYFNAHRAFTRDYILAQCAPLVLVEDQYIYGTRLFDTYDAPRGFGTGLFHFRSPL